MDKLSGACFPVANCCHQPGLPVLAELGESTYLYLGSPGGWEETEETVEYACTYQAQAMQCIFTLTDLKFTNVNTGKGGQVVSWLVQENLLKIQPNSSLCHIFLFPGNFYVAFSFSVRGNVTIEIFSKGFAAFFFIYSI